jgi:hypothetical protein
MRTLAVLPFLALALPACSGSDDPFSSGSTSGGAAGGPRGAVNMEVYATEAQACPPGNVHIDIGLVNATPPTLVEHGVSGASVTCSVARDGGVFAASGALSSGSLAFSFDGVNTGGDSAIGAVGFRDPASGVDYASSDDKPCVFQFAPGTGQDIGPGSIFVQFDCANLVSAGNPGDSCSSRYGYLLLEGCEGGEGGGGAGP